jgi:hypothetical protein
MPEAMVYSVRIWYQTTGAGKLVVQIHGALALVTSTLPR